MHGYFVIIKKNRKLLIWFSDNHLMKGESIKCILQIQN